MLACALTVAGAWLPGLHFLGEAPGTENSGVMHSDDRLKGWALGVRSVSLFSFRKSGPSCQNGLFRYFSILVFLVTKSAGFCSP